MARTAGEMDASADGYGIADLGRSVYSYWHSATRVEMQYANPTNPNGNESTAHFETDFQLLIAATEELYSRIKYTQESGYFYQGDSADGAIDGVYEDGPSMISEPVGKPVTAPVYDPMIPRKTLITYYHQTQNDVAIDAEVQAAYLGAYPSLSLSAAEETTANVAYEVTCTDPGRWTVFNPNRPCSAYLMKYILAGNLNRLGDTSRIANSVAI